MPIMRTKAQRTYRKRTLFLRGSGGGGGSSNSTPVRTDDNLLSTDYMESVLALSEGPIRGLVADSLTNVFIGETPLQNLNGELNFKDFGVEAYLGTSDSPPIKYLLGGETSTISVGVQLAQNAPVTRQTPSTARGAINVLEFRIRFSQLYVQNDKGVYNNTARFRISYKPSQSSTWIDYNGLSTITVLGKTSAGYTKDYSIAVPYLANDDYDVRVTKFNSDSSTTDFCVMIWESLQMTRIGDRSYPNVALLHLSGKATAQFSSVPDFSSVIDGLVIDVPTNYNADAHTYDLSSPWNGTMKKSWTNNPVWVLYALINNPRWGLRKYYPHVTTDRYSFYDAALWCDEMVPNGLGGVQPRYTYNDVIQEQRNGLDLLQYVAGSFNAIIFDDMNGTVHLRVDKWMTPTILFNPESVGAAGFSYSYSDITTRCNDITVSFINPQLDWTEDRRRVFDQSQIDKYGRIPLDFVAVGCTDIREAQRRAQYQLLTATTEVCTITFDTNRLGMLVEPFSTVWIADPNNGWSSGGRVKSFDWTTGMVYLRDPVYVTTLTTLPMKLQGFEVVYSLGITPTNIGECYSFHIVSYDFPAGNIPLFPEYPVFTIEEAGFLGLAKPFRVVSVSEMDSSPDHYQISALEVNRNKYSDADNMVSSPTVTYSYRPPGKPLGPLGVIVESGTKHLARSADGTLISRIYVAWERPNRAFVDHYEVSWALTNSDSWSLLTTTMDDIYLAPVQDNVAYDIYITGVSPTGERSVPFLIHNYTVIGKTEPPANAEWANPASTLEDFGIRLNWKSSTELDFSEFELRMGGTNWETATLVARLKSTSFFTKANSSGNLTYRLKAIDTSGIYSTADASIVVVIPAPSTASVTAVISGQDMVMAWKAVAGAFAISYYEIRMGDTYAASVLLEQTKTIGYTQHIDFGGQRVFWVSAVDVAGNKGTPTSVQLNILVPNPVVITSQVIDNNVLLNWTDSTRSLPIVSYDIRKGTSWENSTVIGDNGNGRFAVFFEQAAGVFTYWIRALDTAGNVSETRSIAVTVNQPPDYILRLDYNADFEGIKWDFVTQGDMLGWYSKGATLTSNGHLITLTATSTDPQLRRNISDFILYGCEYQKVVIGLRRIAGSGWDGVLFYTTMWHGESAGFAHTIPDPLLALGEMREIVFDMGNQSVGAPDWKASQITALRFDFGTTAADIFEIDYIRLVPQNTQNIAMENKELYPIIKDETWQQFFQRNAWDNPQDSVTAGKDSYWSGNWASGEYEEIINYGAVLAATSVTATLSTQQVAGATVVTPSIGYKKNWADAWTMVAGVSSVVATDFQFVRVLYSFSTSALNCLLKLSALNVKISSKAKNDSGNAVSIATDVGGTLVNFNTNFVDINALTVTPKGTTPIIAIYDFVDVPYPTSFKVLLFNTSGSRVTAEFSWTAKGV